MTSEISTNELAFNLLQKARNKFEAEQYATALQYCQAALAIYKEIGDQTGVGYALINMGNIYIKQAVESYKDAQSNFKNDNLLISKEITQSITSALENQLNWYSSNNGNTEILTVSDPGAYWGHEKD